MLKEALAQQHLNNLWDCIEDATELFVPVHPRVNGRVILFVDRLDKETGVGEIRAFLSEDDIKSYLATLGNNGAFVRYSIERLTKNMHILKDNKPDMKLSVVLYTVDISQKFYQVDTVWGYSTQ